jgi:YidC/Oxa1 family membrane protein insertase
MMRFQKKMQRMKPELDELKARHGDNRIKLNQEMQKLWKKHDVNPAQQMAGCLIIFLQLPIWFGLYSTLQYAIGLRQAPFLYIEDLTRPDMLFSFGYALPWIGEWFNLLPLLYVILTVVNQRLQPKPEDPQMLAQYKMMTFMLVFFGFIFYSFPAGFMLYIMTSAALGIIESKIIKAELARDPEIGTVATGENAAAQSSPGSAMYPARQKKSGASAAPQKGKSRSGR